MKINLNAISHSYDNNKNCLTNITLQLNKGITGLLGVNGAGKSSLLNILATVIKPKRGQYTADGLDALLTPFEIRNHLGYLPQNMGYIPELSVFEFLKYMSLLKGCNPKQMKENINFHLENVNLLGAKDRKLKSLSGGMKQRVGIAQALINQPRLLILDEPVVGLDPNERNTFNQLLSKLAKDTTIILSSHIIDDIENICENVILLEAGVIKYTGSVLELIKSVNGLVYEALVSRESFDELNNNYLITRVKPVQDRLLVRYISNRPENGAVSSPCLEDAFIYKTKNITAHVE